MSDSEEPKLPTGKTVHSEFTATTTKIIAPDQTPRKKLSKLSRMCLFFFFFLSFSWFGMKIFWSNTFLDIPEIHAHLNAKEICSCIFVEGIPDDRCAVVHRQLFSPSNLEVDHEKKAVFARTLYAVAKAEFVNEYEGCKTVY